MQNFYQFIWWFQDNFYIILILLYGDGRILKRYEKIRYEKSRNEKHVIKHTFLFAQFKKLSYLCTELKK